jgi:MFS family permease
MNARTTQSSQSLPISLWSLSIGAFFLNLASVLCFTLTPILLRTEFKKTANSIGMLEGTVEGMSLLVRAFSGLFSDFFRRRKVFIAWGYGVSVVSRFLLAPATLIEQVYISRFLEKVGNGLQASPREAYISDITPCSMIGRAYSLNKTLSMAGSLTGGVLMLYLSYGGVNVNIRSMIWFAAGCTALAFTILTLGTKDSVPVATGDEGQKKTVKDEWIKIVRETTSLSRYFWMTIGVVCLFKMGLFSGTFLMNQLYHSDATFLGMKLNNSEFFSNSVFQLVQNVSCVLMAYPMGALSDRVDRRKTVAMACVFMIVAIFLFSKGASSVSMYIGIVSYGLQYSLHGSLMAWLSLVMPRHLFGTGFGIFYLTSGLAVIASNKLLTSLSDYVGLETAFLTIAGFVLVGLVLIPFVPERDPCIKQGS